MKSNEINKKKRGRPVKEKEKLSYSINLKLTGKDFSSVKQKADRLGLKATQYAREIVLKGAVKSRFTLEELDLIRKLSGMANNLNQIAKKANSAGFSWMESNIRVIVEEIKKLLRDR
ncbi:MAG: MobC family plasmid mobilization relaxosome protein [Tannerellaceae bacterium]|nr:MobC family plasmid mobilization relaxosome protein [Tannerellaceae bacterium]